MSCKIIIDYNHTLTRIAVIEENQQVTLYIENHLDPSLQDWIVQGRIEKIVKNLQGVFVEFGQANKGLLHLSQIPAYYDGKIQQGKRLPVQIKRENVGEKGHKLTARLSIKGEYLVCLPFESVTVFSKKIRNRDQKESIRKMLEEHNNTQYGFMVRTKAVEVTEEQLTDEMSKLIEQTNRILQMEKALGVGDIIWKEEPLYIDLIKELQEVYEEIECISNSQEIIKHIQSSMLSSTDQSIVYQVKHPSENLFAVYSLEKNFENLFKQKIWLKNGGNIVIEYTEAMTIIDVNSAKAIEGKNKAQTIRELNKFAVEESIIQMINRNLSGIIIIDLIDFLNKEDKEECLKFAKQLLTKYRDKRSKIYPLTELNLLQISRSKESIPYPHALLENCKGCGQRSKKMSLAFYVFKIEQKLKMLSLNTTQKKIFLTVRPELARYLREKCLLDVFEHTYCIKITIKENNTVEEWYDIKYYD